MRDKTLTSVLRVSCRLYGFLLPLYPSTLRYQFGSDMVEVFEQQIRHECEDRGFTGVARVWHRVASEVILSSVPREFLWTRVGVPVVSVLATLALFECFLRASALSVHYIK
jgi:hypothetical protein